MITIDKDEIAAARMAKLLEKAKAGRSLSRTDRNDLRVFCGGRLPWEKEEPVVKEAETPKIDPTSLVNAMTIIESSKADGLPLWKAMRDRREASRLFESREWSMLTEIAKSCMMERPTVPVWQWAGENVFLDEVATAEPGFYDITRTPWAREWQELPLRPEVRVVAIKKPSRCGASEAALNIIRWMPKFWPGNAGLAYPDDKQARDVVDRRLLRSIRRICESQRTGDKDDEGLSNINLINMAIRAGGSASSRLFTEWWVRFWLLDEIEEHDTSDTTSTFKRALSRQADVVDALLFAVSKPKRTGGPIDDIYVQGSQKKYLVPCPRCEQRIEFFRNRFRYDHARRDDGSWDLEAVIAGTWYQCQHCNGRIEEKEKRAMLQDGIWTPTPPEQRRHNAEGKYVPPTPGWESYQLSDYYALHHEVRWGKLMAQYLTAFEINPSIEDQVHFINNHEGECDDSAEIVINTDSIAALQAGRTEVTEITLPDGTKEKRAEVLGIPGGFRLAYLNGAHNARLPIKPDIIVAFADKQQSCIKFLVFAVVVKPKVAAYLIDLGQMEDEDQLYSILFHREYWIAKSARGDLPDRPMRITGGFMDSRYRGQAVYKMCLKAHTNLGMEFWPVRGEGLKAKRDKQGRATTVLVSEATKGKLFRTIEDSCELGKLMVRYFKDHTLQTELAVNKIGRRAGWRIWLPTDYPESLASEITAEYYDKETDTYVHNKAKFGPNDWRDCMKYLVLWMIENMAMLITEFGGDQSELDELPPINADDEDDAKPRGRDYVLTPPH